MLANYTGSLVGCAIGDSLGMPVEGWKRNQIKKYVGKITDLIDSVIVTDDEGFIITQDEFGKLEYWTKGLKKGQYTDDTILSLALARSLLNTKDFDLCQIAEDQLDCWVDDQGFGGTTISAFEKLKVGVSPAESGVIGSPGTGSCMKMAPLGLFAHANDCKNSRIENKEIFTSFQELPEQAKLVGKITHLDPRSVVAGMLQAYGTYLMLYGTDRETFLASLVDKCEEWEEPLTKQFKAYKQGNLTDRLHWLLENSDITLEEAYKKFNCKSPVYNAYPMTLFCVYHYWDTPFDGLIDLVNLGGDCDTTGAMYGSLMGALHGDSIFPIEMQNKIIGIDKIRQLGKGFYQLSQETE